MRKFLYLCKLLKLQAYYGAALDVLLQLQSGISDGVKQNLSDICSLLLL